MGDLARIWMRRIALGLPLVAAPFGGALLSGSGGCGPCPEPFVRRFPIDEAQASMVLAADGGVSASGCAAVCGEVDRGLADGTLPDGGRHQPLGWLASCRLVPEGEMLLVECSWEQGCPGGRRPRGLIDVLPQGTREGAGAWLAQIAWMERASIHAFEDLALDLVRFGAPAHLVRGALRAARDEQRHAALVDELASSRGASPPPVIREPPRAHGSLVELARDNAAEGGVRETYGALLASIQATSALDGDVREAMAVIARDEARHALLSAAIGDWLRPLVDAGEITAAREHAARALSRAVIHEPIDEADARRLGLPGRAARSWLAAALA